MKIMAVIALQKSLEESEAALDNSFTNVSQSAGELRNLGVTIESHHILMSKLNKYKN